MDWYGILQTGLYEEAIIKKQYRKLPLLLHPDKNKFAGAQTTFKLIGEANSVLADKAKRSLYDMNVKAHVRHAVPKTSYHHSNGNVFAGNQVPNFAEYWKKFSSNISSFNAHLRASMRSCWTICTHCNWYQFSTYTIYKAPVCLNSKNSFIPLATSQQVGPSSVPFGAPKVAPMRLHNYFITNGIVFAANKFQMQQLIGKTIFQTPLNPHLKVAQRRFMTICTHCKFIFHVYIYNFKKATICQNCKKSFVALAYNYQAAPSSVPFCAPKVSQMQVPQKPASKSNCETPFGGGYADTFVWLNPSYMKTCLNGVVKQHIDEKCKDGCVHVSKPIKSQSSNNVGSKRGRQPGNNEDVDIFSKKPRQTTISFHT